MSLMPKASIHVVSVCWDGINSTGKILTLHSAPLAAAVCRALASGMAKDYCSSKGFDLKMGRRCEIRRKLYIKKDQSSSDRTHAYEDICI